jgi:predicted negative regulator of RcsB-dependent stress response
VKRELKQKIKEDEFVSGVQLALDFVRKHRDEVRVSAIVLGVVLIGAALLAQYRASRAARAEAAYASALETLHAPLESQLAAGQPRPERVFSDAAQRAAAAAEAFGALANSDPGGRVGRRARYYAAIARLEAGQLAEAETELRAVAAWRSEEPLLSGLARLALGEVQQRRGDVDAAVQAWREVADEATAPVPRDHALMRAARTLEEAARLTEARASWRRLADEFPRSVYAAEARQRVEFLGAEG